MKSVPEDEFVFMDDSVVGGHVLEMQQEDAREARFGQQMRALHFQFAPSYTPLNHGSFGAYPRQVQEQQDAFTRMVAERPDTFIVYELPILIDKARAAVAPLLGVPMEEVVFVPNATTGINIVLRNLRFEKGDVVVHFSTIYGACEKTLASISEATPVTCESILLQYPIDDEQILNKFRAAVDTVRKKGHSVRLAMFDTVSTFPGVRMPWESLVKASKEMGILSLVDGAHGIGHIDLTHVGKVGPDFFVSNCHKWLYTPRGCAVFHVPVHNQHLIRTSIPTSHGYRYLTNPEPIDKTPFAHLFEFVATIDYTPYLCVQAALDFRQSICGGEIAIRRYCHHIARVGGQRVAEILETEVMGNAAESFNECCFANVKLPLTFRDRDGLLNMDLTTNELGAVDKLKRWLNLTACKEFDTYLQIDFHAGFMWVRLSGQIYLDLSDFEWVGWKLKELCERAQKLM